MDFYIYDFFVWVEGVFIYILNNWDVSNIIFMRKRFKYSLIY